MSISGRTLTAMSGPTSARTRRSLVGATVAVLGTAAVVLVLVMTGIVGPFGNSARHEAEIRSAVDRAGVAETYELTRLPGSPASPGGYTLTLSLEKDANALSAGTLMSTLFGGGLPVEAVNLVYSPSQRIYISSIEREAAQWAALVEFGETLVACNAELSQLGPIGMATYRLDLATETADPQTVYEDLLDAPRPEWVTFGDVHVSTPSGVWPKRTIHAGRDLTVDELDHFEHLVADLGEKAGPNDAYEVEVISTLGHDVAEFRTRILPDAITPTFTTDTGHDPVVPVTPSPSTDPTRGDAP